MFRPLRGNYQVLHLKKRAEGCILYSPQPFSLDVQPDDGLLEAETCTWLAVTIIRCIYIYIYNIVCFIDWQKAFDRVNWTKLMQILKKIVID